MKQEAVVLISIGGEADEGKVGHGASLVGEGDLASR
jgi:hypothetical protein